MKVLVTGAGGFLGGEVFRNLKMKTGWSVIGTRRKTSDDTIACDLSDPCAVWVLLQDIKPDAIINCAAKADFGSGLLSSLSAVNTLAPAIMARWCQNNNTYLLHVSGTLVHGSYASMIHSETPVAPDTDYGRTKWLAEQMIDAICASAGIVRFGGIFGESGPDHLGFNRAIRAARRGVTPTLIGEGRALRNYIHVKDAAAVLCYCVEKQVSGVRWAGGSEILSIAEMLETLRQVYLPDSVMKTEPGKDATDQVVQSSPDLPLGQSLRESLESER